MHLEIAWQQRALCREPGQNFGDVVLDAENGADGNTIDWQTQ